MYSDTDISLDYDDDDTFSDSGRLDVSMDTAHRQNQVPLGGSTARNVHSLLQKSPNFLSSFSYRSQSLQWFIEEHFLHKANYLQATMLPHFSIGELLVMLQQKKWSVDEVTGDYYENWPKLRDACGLSEKRGENYHIVGEVDFTCFICCETGALDTFLLLCNHRFCTNCYSQYIAATIARGELIRCMDTSCLLTLHPEHVDMLYRKLPEVVTISDEDDSAGLDSGDDRDDALEGGEDDDAAYDRNFVDLDLSGRILVEVTTELLVNSRYLAHVARKSIDVAQANYRWCPAVDCGHLAELVHDSRPGNLNKDADCDLRHVPIVKCPNSHEFCFDCQNENHLPCPCWLVELWIRKCEDDSETVNWIEANTQLCPKCKSQIEKNGGCNHITCQKCWYEFCWICLGDWVDHRSNNWVCNRYNAKTKEEIEKRKLEKQESLNRYLHFYRRFAVHQNSMLEDEKCLARVHKCMLVYMKAQRNSTDKCVSWNDIQFLSDAIRALSSGRKTLMWTYAFAFYLKKTNLSEIFEGMQDYLNKTVEDLSMMFAKINKMKKNDAFVKKITDQKLEILNVASLVKRRQQLLVECAHSELKLGNLQLGALKR